MDDTSPPEVESDTGRFAMVPEWLASICTPRSLVIYVHLAVRCDFRDGTLQGMSHAYLAGVSQCSSDTVKRSLLELREHGAVDWSNTVRPDGSPGTNRYRITRMRPVDKGGCMDAPSPHTARVGGCTGALHKTRELLRSEESEIAPPVENERVPLDVVRSILRSAKDKDATTGATAL